MQALPDLNAPRGNYFELIFGIFHSTDTVIVSFQTDDYSLSTLIHARGCTESDDAVPTVRGRHNLHVMFLCGAQYHRPELGLECVVKAVFCLIDEQEAISSIRQCHGHAK